MPKCLQNHIKNVIDLGIDFGRVLAPKTDSKMEPKGDQTLGWYPFFRSPKRFENVASFFDRHLDSSRPLFSSFFEASRPPHGIVFTIQGPR